MILNMINWLTYFETAGCKKIAEDTARDKAILNKLNISNILICAEGCEPFYPNEYTYKIPLTKYTI